MIVVKDKDKDVTYYFDKDSGKKYHGDTCAKRRREPLKARLS